MSNPLKELQAWVNARVHSYAEELGGDLQALPGEDISDILADYAGDRIYAEMGEMAEAFRLLHPDTRLQWLGIASSRISP